MGRRRRRRGVTPAISPLHVAFTAEAAVAAVAGQNYRDCFYKNKMLDREVSREQEEGRGTAKRPAMPPTLG